MATSRLMRPEDSMMVLGPHSAIQPSGLRVVRMAPPGSSDASNTRTSCPFSLEQQSQGEPADAAADDCRACHG
jgi:hypothetical protein